MPVFSASPALVLLATVALWFMTTTVAEAAIVRHLLLPSDSVFSAQTQHACDTYLLQPSPHWCNPALFTFSNDAPIKGDLALSADRDAYDTTSRLLNEPITVGLVDHLFKEKDFQAFSGLARLEAISSVLSFSYTPAYLAGAFQISNPNLPELSAAAARETQMRVTSGRLLFSAGGWNLFGGASAFVFERRVYYVHANALELLANDAKSLVDAHTRKGVNADVGLFLQAPPGVLPAFSLVGESLFLPQQKNIGAAHALDLEPGFRRRFRLGSGYTAQHASGSYYLGLQLPFWDAFREFDRFDSSLAFIYGIGRLRAMTSFSPLTSAFGFMFMSANYQVGIQYTNDKQDNSLEIRRQNNVYLFTSFNF